jgi:hypothetical protein
MQVHRHTRLWVLLAASIAATSALAEGSVSRAQVRAETAAAVAAGQIVHGSANPVNTRAASINSTLSRNDVSGETITAMRAGELARGDAQSYDSQVFASSLSRAEVKAETLASVRLGLVPHGEAPARVATMAELEQVRMAVEDAGTAPRAVAMKGH